MKKRIVIGLLAMTLAAASLTACGSSAETDATATEETTADTAEEAADTTAEETDTEESTEIANPWTDSDQQGVADATGFDMVAPEGASDVAYSYMAEDGLAQMTYKLDDMDWTYRIQSTDELTDISGLAGAEWSSSEMDTVAGLAAQCAAMGDMNEDNTDHYQAIQWFDPDAGVTYSLVAQSQHDMNGMDMTVFASNIFNAAE